MTEFEKRMGKLETDIEKFKTKSIKDTSEFVKNLDKWMSTDIAQAKEIQRQIDNIHDQIADLQLKYVQKSRVSLSDSFIQYFMTKEGLSKFEAVTKFCEIIKIQEDKERGDE